MARPRSADPRTVVIAVRLTKAEAAQVDRERSAVGISRAEWIRWMLLRRGQTR